MNQKTIDVILIVLICMMIIGLAFLIIKFDKEGFDCLANPIGYYSDMKNASCSCQLKTEWNSMGEFNLTIP